MWQIIAPFARVPAIPAYPDSEALDAHPVNATPNPVPLPLPHGAHHNRKKLLSGPAAPLLPGHLHLLENALDDVVDRSPLHLLFGREEEPVTKDGQCHVPNVLRRNEIATL